jgi:hypothetical protein
MPNTSIGGVGPQNQVVGLNQGQGAQNATGAFAGHEVTAGTGENRAGSALKTAWMEVKHFFKSLFGVKVSTDAPTQIQSREDGAKAVLSQLSRSKMDDVSIMETLATFIDHGNFPQDAARDGLTSGSKEVFHSELQNLSDMQLFRIYKNFQAHPELLETLGQLGTAVVIENSEELANRGATPQEMLSGGGKINDLGFATKALYDEVRAALQERGYEVPEHELRALTDATPSHEMEVVAKLAVNAYGDLTNVFSDARAQLAQEKHDALIASLEVAGIYHQDDEPVAQVQAQAVVPQQTLADKRDAALQDPALGTITSVGLSNQENVLGYFSDHFDALSSDAFWSHPQAKINNIETFSSSLAIVVMDRIAAQGAVTRQDIDDLNKVYGHVSANTGQNLAPFTDALIGPLADGNGAPIVDRFRTNFLERNAPAQLNIDYVRQEEVLTNLGTAATIQERFALTKTGQGLMWGGGQDIGILRQAITEPLQRIA